jgi:hypothetical protein
MSTATRLRVRPRGLTDPSTISGLRVWLRAADLALADDTAVATWTDAASALAFIQITGAKQPLYKTAAFNGLPSVRFDGTDDTLAVASALLQTTARTVIMACRSGLADITAGAAILSWNGATGYAGAGADERMRTVYVDGAAATVTAGASAGTQFADVNQRLVLTYLTSVSGSNVTTLQRKNGANRRNTVSATGASVPTSPTIRLSGTSTTPTSPFNGDVAELLAWDRALTLAEYLSVERYLGAKYGVTVS